MNFTASSEEEQYYSSHTMNQILDKIAQQFSISRNQLEDIKTQYPSRDKYSIVPVHPRTSKQGICLAKKQDGQQCTRRCREGSHFCGKHIKSHKFGCVTDDIVPEGDSITMKSEIYEGRNILIDNENIVYQYTDENRDSVEIIGRRNELGGIVLIGEMEASFKPPLKPKQCDLMSMLTCAS